MYYAINNKSHAEEASTSTVKLVRNNMNYTAIIFIIIDLKLNLYCLYLKLIFILLKVDRIKHYVICQGLIVNY